MLHAEDMHQRIYAITTEGMRGYKEGIHRIPPYNLHYISAWNSAERSLQVI